MPENFNIQKVLVAPLDWGLGHATRCISIIHALLNNGYEVVIAAEGAQASLLQTEFPSLTILPLRGYRVRYAKQKWLLSFTLLLQVPSLLRVIRHERNWLDATLKEHAIDLVISDNRYGLYSKKVSCIFITHQLVIKTPFRWLEKIMQRINYHYIEKFSACWVPDVDREPNAAGILSHPKKLPRIKLHYIGLLSRFAIEPASKKYDHCILLSGPEPQRTLLEKKLLKCLAQTTDKILLVRGKPGANEVLDAPANITIQNHLPGSQLQKAILESEYIISRSGYTTVMELLSLRKKAVLIPTPGQTEQEYLAEKLMQDNICLCVDQHAFDCAKHLAMAKTFSYRMPLIPLFDAGKITDLLKASVS